MSNKNTLRYAEGIYLEAQGERRSLAEQEIRQLDFLINEGLLAREDNALCNKVYGRD